jgi:hypothetical protein
MRFSNTSRNAGEDRLELQSNRNPRQDGSREIYRDLYEATRVGGEPSPPGRSTIPGACGPLRPLNPLSAETSHRRHAGTAACFHAQIMRAGRSHHRDDCFPVWRTEEIPEFRDGLLRSTLYSEVDLLVSLVSTPV